MTPEPLVKLKAANKQVVLDLWRDIEEVYSYITQYINY
jgi:hypothetical protein